ncbi:uncharacterized protein PFL1_03784 [Pseudozyma flocculosa PF-1]|uniref:Thioredoxin n=2 Tax=Pseudozyma flocculosa TaxID=84751 RepID=A0A5C3EVX4_9BASI|nr:uncharacterized protein PFL1_03784 [Pseudozyma flocculosa PF-1]EPQ28481.1 hypothetical protein PFL1_03784 [Pseudozyma flocculosa PF-1]SPO36398.1 uncharacterized protein PSFLO_01869 [Pseudozyma flocculosa]
MTQDEQTWPVRLYVYDLSQGMARQLSMALTGRQIDGIWHTSIVAWDREYFFGQGISIASPGTSHHGAPLETYELGHTAIDRDTFEQLLLDDLRPRFRPQDYNLLSWNCNNFTQELAQLLVGADIPDHIRSLPADFLSTPFGQMMKPRIDAMFRGPSVGATPNVAASSSPGAGLLDQVASRAFTGNEPMQSSGRGAGTAGPSSSDPVRHIYTKADLDALLETFPCVAVLFTSDTCPPCRIVKPEFSSLAHRHHADQDKPGPHKRIGFAQVDAGPATQALMQACGISATPTVSCYARGTLSGQVKGADVGELRSAVDLMLFDVYPFHPHTQLKRPLKAFRSIPTAPHAFRAVPNLQSALQRLDAALAEHPAKSFAEKADLQDARKCLAATVIPFLEANFDAQSKSAKATPRFEASKQLRALEQATAAMLKVLAPEQLFPLVDMIRLALLIDDFAAGLLAALHDSGQASQGGPLLAVLTRVQQLAADGCWDARRRPVYLTTARLLGNLTASDRFMDAVEYHEPLKQTVLDLITSLLLCEDAGVRSSAATSSFNIALHEHKLRPDWTSRDASAPPGLGSRMGEGWETEMASALVQAISNEAESDETLHRLCASLLLTLHLSPFWQEHLLPLLEVLEARDAFTAKLDSSVVKGSTKSEELAGLLRDLQALSGSS